MELEQKKYAWHQFIDDLSRELRDEYLANHKKYTEKEFNSFFNKAQSNLKKEVELDKNGVLECLMLFGNNKNGIAKLKNTAEKILLNQLKNNFKGILLHSI